MTNGNSFWQTIQPYIIGSSFTVAGFWCKQLLDYFYLKSPRIVVDVTASDIGTNPPRNGYRDYAYSMEVKCFNHSTNDAYGFKIKRFKMDAAFTPGEVADQNNGNKLLKSEAPFIMHFGYVATLEITPQHTYSLATQRFTELNKAYTMEIEFRNSLGKLYTQTITGTMSLKQKLSAFYAE